MPVFLHKIPIYNYSSFYRIDDFLSSSKLLCFIADCEVKSFCDFSVAHGPAGFRGLITWVCDESRDIEWGLWIAGISHFGIARAIIYDDYFAIEIHEDILYLSIITLR